MASSWSFEEAANRSGVNQVPRHHAFSDLCWQVQKGKKVSDTLIPAELKGASRPGAFVGARRVDGTDFVGHRVESC